VVRFEVALLSAFTCSGTILGICVSSNAWAQATDTPPPFTLQNPARGGNLLDFLSVRTPLEFWLTCVIIVYGLVVLLILLWGMRGLDRRADDVSRSIIILSVIFGALVLVTAGFTNEQTAPVFGLFGTIVGYILGRMSRRESNQDQTPAPQP
jgi:O-antigen ligase